MQNILRKLFHTFAKEETEKTKETLKKARKKYNKKTIPSDDGEVI